MEKAKHYFLVWGWNNIFVFGGILTAGLAIALYLVLGRGAVAGLTEQMLHREQVITRSGAKYLESFFAVVSRSMVVLANSENMRAGLNTQQLLDKFIDTWAGTSLVGVVVSSDQGIVQYSGSRERLLGDEWVSVKDRDYFKWAASAKEWEVRMFPPVLSRSGGTKGKYVIPVTAPIFDHAGKFKGEVTAVLLLSELARDYTAPLEISDQTRSFLVAKNGDVWFSSQGNFDGKNILHELDGAFTGSGVIKLKAEDALKSKREGKIEIALPLFEDRTTLQTYLIAYSPVNLESESGYLILATPRNDVLAYVGPFYLREMGMMFMLFAVILVISIRVAKMNAVVEERREQGRHP